MVSFNPFKKELGELEPSDLSVLRDVAEGWYVEYKGELVDSKSIAKSLAAFANHYGGWIFYGVRESKDGFNVAESFPGLDKQSVSLIIERLRNASKDIVNPSPYYEYKVIEGPITEIGLPDGQALVVVAVPIGSNAPYIHNDGRIYRRIADSSDPKPETDRFTLDHLWQRGQIAQNKLTSFLEMEPELSEGESNTSFVDIFLLPDPLENSGQRTRLNFETFVELMKNQISSTFSLPFDNFYPMPGGVVGRQVSDNTPNGLVLTWRHYGNGFSWITLPLATGTLIGDPKWLLGYVQETAIKKLIKDERHDYSSLIDLNQVILATIAIISQQRELMKKGGINGPLYSKCVLHNVWRRIPFLDTDEYIQFVAEHGLPVIQFKKEFVPPGTSFKSLKLLEDASPDSGDQREALEGIVRQSVPLMTDILNAFGLPVSKIVDGEGWFSTSERAMEVGKSRSQRSTTRYI